MKRWTILSLLVLFVLVLSACAPTLPVPLTSGPTTTPVPTEPAPEPQQGGHIPVDLPPAQLKALQALAEALGIPVSEIQVISVEAVDWPNGCLGIQPMGVLCTMNIVPGFRVILEANGSLYDYHTNQDGSQLAQANRTLVWEREGGFAGFCDKLVVFLPNDVFGSSCKMDGGAQNSLTSVASESELAQLDQWLTNYGEVKVTVQDPATADAMKVSLVFNGQGQGQPDAAAQQAMIDWAQNLYNNLNSAK